jgi:hypothetical protein
MGRALKQLQHVLPSLRCPAVLGNFFELKGKPHFGLGLELIAATMNSVNYIYFDWFI